PRGEGGRIISPPSLPEFLIPNKGGAQVEAEGGSVPPEYSPIYIICFLLHIPPISFTVAQNNCKAANEVLKSVWNGRLLFFRPLFSRSGAGCGPGGFGQPVHDC
ncbi:MAG: hypothetical protein IJD04_07155, partial [Desulfovibrionaceae bacterium]|nr:hypothetical protein [Desulfovibrionaceae bacterium]